MLLLKPSSGLCSLSVGDASCGLSSCENTVQWNCPFHTLTRKAAGSDDNPTGVPFHVAAQVVAVASGALEVCKERADLKGGSSSLWVLEQPDPQKGFQAAGRTGDGTG